MKKILAFIGSQKGEKSNTFKFTKLLLDTLINRYPNEIDYEILHPKNTNLIPCQSCNQCFIKGYCKLDERDDMKIIKEKLLTADFVIFGSPVFLHHVSSDMKLVIDRLSYWAHLFKLVGKKSASISVSSSNGNHFVNDYLSKVLDYLGTQVVCNLAITVDDPPLLSNSLFLKVELPKYADTIYNSLKDEEISTSDLQDKYYYTMLNTFKKFQYVRKKKNQSSINIGRKKVC